VSRDGMTGTTRRAFATVARALREEAARAQRAKDVALAQELRRDAARVEMNAHLVDERRKRA
jgi:hypothetical protein